MTSTKESVVSLAAFAPVASDNHSATAQLSNFDWWNDPSMSIGVADPLAVIEDEEDDLYEGDQDLTMMRMTTGTMSMMISTTTTMTTMTTTTTTRMMTTKMTTTGWKSMTTTLPMMMTTTTTQTTMTTSTTTTKTIGTTTTRTMKIGKRTTRIPMTPMPIPMTTKNGIEVIDRKAADGGGGVSGVVAVHRRVLLPVETVPATLDQSLPDVRRPHLLQRGQRRMQQFVDQPVERLFNFFLHGGLTAQCMKLRQKPLQFVMLELLGVFTQTFDHRPCRTMIQPSVRRAPFPSVMIRCALGHSFSRSWRFR